MKNLIEEINSYKSKAEQDQTNIQPLLKYFYRTLSKKFTKEKVDSKIEMLDCSQEFDGQLIYHKTTFDHNLNRITLPNSLALLILVTAGKALLSEEGIYITRHVNTHTKKIGFTHKPFIVGDFWSNPPLPSTEIHAIIEACKDKYPHQSWSFTPGQKIEYVR